jgi:hypothetical protein
MDSNDLERERGITILAKNTAVRYKVTDRLLTVQKNETCFTLDARFPVRLLAPNLVSIYVPSLQNAT